MRVHAVTVHGMQTVEHAYTILLDTCHMGGHHACACRDCAWHVEHAHIMCGVYQVQMHHGYLPVARGRNAG